MASGTVVMEVKEKNNFLKIGRYAYQFYYNNIMQQITEIWLIYFS